jgi:membrane protein
LNALKQQFLRAYWSVLQAFQFLWFVARRFSQYRCMQSAASLTTTTLFSLVPVVTLSITLFSLFPEFIRVNQAVHSFMVANMLPEVASRVVSVYMTQFSDHASQLTYAGLVLLLVTALSLAITVDNTFNAIWGSDPRRSWWSRLAIYATLILLGPVLLGLGLWLLTLVISASVGWAGEGTETTQSALRFFSILLLAGTLAVAYYKIPGRPVRGRHALIGGIIAALVFELMKNGFTLFIARFTTYKLVYGAFAAFPIFLLWIDLSWVVVLFCAVLTANLPLHKNQAWKIDDIEFKR